MPSVMPVPAAFRTAPRRPTRSRKDDVCTCGSALNEAYVTVAGEDGLSRHVKTPVMWCQRCRLPAYSRPVKGQAEVRGARFKWACERCGGSMCRLRVARGSGGEVCIPLSYCMRCVSVSFRPTAGSEDVRMCDMCGTEVPARNRWCAKCIVIVALWRNKHGSIPPSGDKTFPAVIGQARAEARRLGWDRGANLRACPSCSTLYEPAGRYQRFCNGCAAARERLRLEKVRGRQGPRRQKERPVVDTRLVGAPTRIR